MMADSDTTGTTENSAGTDDSIAYSPEWTDETFADIGHACIEMKDHGDAAVSVGTKSDDGIVSLSIEQSQMMRVCSYMSADTAEWLAEQLQEHAAKVRQAD
jgi:hypothetical protein